MVLAIHQHKSTIGIYVSPSSWRPLPPPSPPYPFGLSQRTRLGALLHALNLHQSSILHMLMNMFNAILSNHPTFSFSHWVQKSVLYVYVFFAALHWIIGRIIGTMKDSCPLPQIHYSFLRVTCWIGSFMKISLSTPHHLFCHCGVWLK